MTQVTPMHPIPIAHRRALRCLAGLFLLAIVCTPLLLYPRPAFLVMLADMLWACF